MKKTIAILGTGPAGLMAAQACAIAGRPFALFGMPDVMGQVQPSVISGAQFIHTAVPTINDKDEPDFELTYIKMGTAAGYQHKVYGSDEVPFVSFDRVQNGEVIPAWSLRKTYERMWEGICGPQGHSVNPLHVKWETIQSWIDMDTFSTIICTIPRMEICRAYHGHGDRPHSFISQPIVVSDTTGYAQENQIVYNGDEEYSWYRSSLIDGVGSTEWGGQQSEQLRKAYKDLRTIKKPIRHDCDCWEGTNVVFAGRYGEWRKGVLTHEAFVTTWNTIMGDKK